MRFHFSEVGSVPSSSVNVATRSGIVMRPFRISLFDIRAIPLWGMPGLAAVKSVKHRWRIPR